jgi:Sulfotransferase family
MEVWLRSKAFQRSGLERGQIRSRILERCKSGGEFYRIVMGEIARSQGVERWAAYDPDNALYIPRIHEEIPEALFIHIIRDGRDVAFGLSKKNWIPYLPWDSGRRILIMGAFWQWMVTKGRVNGKKAAANYIEVRFEDLVVHPRETLAQLGAFLKHDLDYERILQSSVGVVARPNSSHRLESAAGGFSPARRWKQQLSPEDVASFEAVYGGLLKDLGYETSSNGAGSAAPMFDRLVNILYPLYFETKLQLKSRTPLGRFASLAHLEIQGTQNGRRVA